jgi:hypothetical protein
MSSSDNSSKIEIRGRVVDYAISALMEDFAGGGHRSQDATTLEILAPPRLKGSRLTLYHDEPANADSPWRAIGATLNFTIDAALLNEGVQIFAGAAQNVRRSQDSYSEDSGANASNEAGHRTRGA